MRLSHYLQQAQFTQIAQLVNNCVYHLQAGRYRQQAFVPFQTPLEQLDRPVMHDDNQLDCAPSYRPKPYFEVLVIHPFPDDYEMLYMQQLAAFKSPHDEFIYDLVFVDSAEDALNAMLANTDIQACVYLNRILPSTQTSAPQFATYSRALVNNTPPVLPLYSVEVNLCRSIRCLRPEVDHHLISEQSPTDVPHAIRQNFTRVLFHIHPFHDLHAAVLSGVRNRFSTPSPRLAGPSWPRFGSRPGTLPLCLYNWPS